jgi:hypothetical protein
MKNIFLIICLLIPNFCYAENEMNPQLKLKVINTFVQLGYYNPKECLDIINAIESRSKQCEKFEARFVKDAYENNATELDTTDCKIIWKAILITCRAKQDGFELMDVPTPWIKNSY